MFLECSLYGSCSEISDNCLNDLSCKKYTRTTRIFTNENRETIYLHDQNGELFLSKYLNIDRNKQRTCLVLGYETFRCTKTEEEETKILSLLSLLKFNLTNTQTYDVFEYNTNGYTVEYSKSNKVDHIKLSDEEESEDDWFVKAYCFTKNAQEGEKKLKTTYADLGLKMSFSTDIFTYL